MLISLPMVVSPQAEIPLLSVTHGQCDARPTVTFPAYAGTKFILFGDSWLPRILILQRTTCLDSLDIISRPRPDSYPGRYTDQASEHVRRSLRSHTLRYRYAKQADTKRLAQVKFYYESLTRRTYGKHKCSVYQWYCQSCHRQCE